MQAQKKGVCMTPLVIQAGFEPTTHSLEGCCSIQLSYWTSPFAFISIKSGANLLNSIDIIKLFGHICRIFAFI